MTYPDYPVPAVTGGSYQEPTDSQRNYMYVTYGLYALGLLVGISPLVGVILAYVKRDDMRGTIFHDHMRYLIRTFWGTLLGTLLGVLLLVVLVGYLVLALAGVWYIFRVVVGIIRMLDNRPVTPTGWWM